MIERMGRVPDTITDTRLMHDNVYVLLQELAKERQRVPNLLYDGVTVTERFITKAEELRRANEFLSQFNWQLEEFSEDARRLIYRVCVGYYGLEGPLPIAVHQMVADDSAAVWKLWPPKVLRIDHEGKEHGTASDSFAGYSTVSLLLSNKSTILSNVPPMSQELIGKLDLETQLSLIHRAMAYILGGVEIVSQISSSWKPENRSRTEAYHESNIRIAVAAGHQPSVHLSFIDNANLIDEKPRLFNTVDKLITGQNRQGKVGAEQENLAYESLEDLTQQMLFFGRMREKYQLPNMHMVLHLGILGKELTDTEFKRGMSNLTYLLQYARRFGLTIALENQGMSLDQYKKIMEIFPEEEYPELGFCFDTAHAQIEFSQQGENGIRKLWSLIGHRVVHVHIAQTQKLYSKNGEFLRYVDTHPRLQCHHRGITLSELRWVIVQAQNNGQNVTFTIEAPPHAPDILKLFGKKPKRNVLTAAPDDLPLEPFDTASGLLQSEVSQREVELTEAAMTEYYKYADVDEYLTDKQLLSADRDEVEVEMRRQLAWKATMDVTNWSKTDVHKEWRDTSDISAHLDTLLRKVEPAFAELQQEGIALSRHSAILVLLFAKLESIQKKLLSDPHNPELHTQYDRFESIVQEFAQEANDVDIVLTSDRIDPTTVQEKLHRAGLRPRKDADSDGRPRDGSFRAGGLSEFYGGPHEAGFLSMLGSAVCRIGDDENSKVEIMAKFAIQVPGYDEPVPLSFFAEKLGISQTISVRWAGKEFTLLHPTLIMLSYFSEAQAYQKGPRVFNGNYKRWAEKKHKAKTRSRLTFLHND